MEERQHATIQTDVGTLTDLGRGYWFVRPDCRQFTVGALPNCLSHAVRKLVPIQLHTEALLGSLRKQTACIIDDTRQGSQSIVTTDKGAITKRQTQAMGFHVDCVLIVA